MNFFIVNIGHWPLFCRCYFIICKKKKVRKLLFLGDGMMNSQLYSQLYIRSWCCCGRKRPICSDYMHTHELFFRMTHIWDSCVYTNNLIIINHYTCGWRGRRAKSGMIGFFRYYYSSTFGRGFVLPNKNQPMDKREKKVQQSPSKVKLDFVQRPIKLSKKEKKNLTDLIICEFMCKSMTLAAQSVSLPV